jgi:hypothetical protein
MIQEWNLKRLSKTLLLGLLLRALQFLQLALQKENQDGEVLMMTIAINTLLQLRRLSNINYLCKIPGSNASLCKIIAWV